MGYTNSPLIDDTVLAGTVYGDRTALDRLTWHHAAGRIKAKALAGLFIPKSRNASANYYIGCDAKIILGVPESQAACTSSNKKNDMRAITFEISNDKCDPDWTIADDVYAKAIELTVDICKRNGIKYVFNIQDEINKCKTRLGKTSLANGYKVPAGTAMLTFHQYFYATACPGPWIMARIQQITDDINAGLVEPKPVPKPSVSIGVQTVPNSGAKLDFDLLDFSYVLDWEFYKNHYPDLTENGLHSKEQYEAHFKKRGILEARQGNSTFNPVKYKEYNSDLANLYEDNWQWYYAHYILFGRNEGRRAI